MAAISASSQCLENAMQIVKCLKKYDESHQQLYNDKGMRIAEALCRVFGESVRLYSCTEDPQISGKDPRVDAVVEANDRKYAVEAKLSLTSGASLGRQLFKKAQKTLEKLQIAAAYLVLLVPGERLADAEEMLSNYVTRVLRNHSVRTERGDVILHIQLDAPLPSIWLKRRHAEFLNVLRHYRLSGVALLPI